MGGLVASPSPRSLSADSNRSMQRKKRSSSSRARGGGQHLEEKVQRWKLLIAERRARTALPRLPTLLPLDSHIHRHYRTTQYCITRDSLFLNKSHLRAPSPAQAVVNPVNVSDIGNSGGTPLHSECCVVILSPYLGGVSRCGWRWRHSMTCVPVISGLVRGIR
jgi:hypothetical protein